MAALAVAKAVEFANMMDPVSLAERDSTFSKQLRELINAKRSAQATVHK